MSPGAGGKPAAASPASGDKASAKEPPAPAPTPAPEGPPAAEAPPTPAVEPTPAPKPFEPIAPLGTSARPRSKSALFDIPGPGGGLGGLTPRGPAAKNPASEPEEAPKPTPPGPGKKA